MSGFGGPGIIMLGGQTATFRSNEASGNGEYGIFSLFSSQVTKAKIVNNSSRKNLGEGVLLFEASQGQIVGNALSENCAGLSITNVDFPGDTHGWIVKNNSVRLNNRSCPGAPDGAPPASGIGILVAGARDIGLRGNDVLDNKPTGPSAFGSGGILVSSTAGFGGSDPNNVAVVKNTILRNQPTDLAWDGSGTGNVFTNNQCGTSTPSGLCN